MSFPKEFNGHFLFKALLALALTLAVAGASAQTCAIPGNDAPATTVTGIVNSYFPGIGTGASSIQIGVRNSLGATTPIAVGDLLLIIQMQGADINSNNNNTYGDGLGDGTTQISDVFGDSNYAGGFLNNGNFTAGRYEYAVATSASSGSGTVTLASALQNTYLNGANQRFQVIRVPQYPTLSIGGGGLTAAAWDGGSGGVVAIDVAGLLTLGNINVNGLGFRAGGVRNINAVTAPQYSGYRELYSSGSGGMKGEGIAATPARTYSVSTGLSALAATDSYPGGDIGRGAPANAGGGGNQHNCGGGGGANGGAGGRGGACWNGNVLNTDGPLNGSHGGSPVLTAANTARLFLGGGGGASDVGGNGSTDPQGSGGAGGGLIIVRAGTISGSGAFNANGDDATDILSTDGTGGGGAGGTIFVQTQSGSTTGISMTANGGRGGNASMGASNPEHDGPGGGGGGGVVYSSSGTTGNTSAGVSGGILTTQSTSPGDPPSAGLARYYARAGFDGFSASINAPIAGTGARASAACLPILSLSKSTSTPSISASGATTATYSINVQNTGGGARNISIIDNALPPGWTLATAPTYSYTPALPMAAGNLASGAEASNSSGGATFPLSVAAPLTSPAVGDNSLTWNNFFIAPIINGVGGQMTINYTVNIPTTAPVACYHNPAGFTFLDSTRTGDRLVTSATLNGANRGAINYSANTTYATGNTSSVGGTHYSGLVAGGSAEDICLQADLSVTKTGPATLATGASGTYIITPRNNGRQIRDTTFAADQTTAVTNSNASTRVLANGVVRMTDTVPAGLTIVGTPSGTNWTCSVTGQVATCDYATLPLPANTDLPAISANVQATIAACPGPLSNTAIVDGIQAPYLDSNPTNNTSAAVTTAVSCTADLSIEKTDGVSTTASGSTVTYVINVANAAGGASADGARVTDPVANGLNCTTLTCSATGGAACPTGAVNAGPVSLVAATFQSPGYVIPTLPAGGNLSFSLTCSVTATGF
jgi:mucin-19